MRRKRRLLAFALAVCVVTAGIPLTGAFTSISADRSVSVAVASDANAFLALEPGEGPNGAYAKQTDGTLELRFDGSGVLGDGLNPNAKTTFGDVFSVTNQGTDQTRIRIRDDTQGIAFYATIGETRYRLDGSNATGAPLPVGDELNVTVTIDSQNESAIESVDEITIEASSTDQGTDGNESTNPPSGSDDVPTTNVRDGQLQLTGAAEPGDSLQLDLTDLPNASSDRIETRSVRINYTEETSLRTTVGVNSTDGTPAAPENGTVLTYLNVSHPQTPDSAIGDATFQFVVPHDDDPPGAIDLLRYNTTTGTWETQATEVRFVRNSSDGYVYEAQTSSLSLFAVVERVRGLLIKTEETSATLDASFIANPNSSFPTSAYARYQNQSFNDSYWNERATENADDAAAVIREKLRVSLRKAAKDALIDKAVAVVDNVLKTTLRVSGIGTLLTAIDITLSSSEFVGSFGPAIQQQAVAIHVDPGTESHDRLQSNLEALERNSRELKTAVQNDNAARQTALLREREQLLEETYRLLPRYVDDVHTDVINNTAGLEDPRAYKLIRSNAESLRMVVLLDHQITTKRLYGAPDRSLARETSMPTHGWTAFGRSEVYDTIDHTDDYVVLRIDGSRAVAANNSLDIDIRGTNASAFETVLVSERPDTPRQVEGRELTGIGTRVSEVVAPEDDLYLVIRSDGAVGPVRTLVNAGNTTVPVSVVERAGPDIQRPHADLMQSPEPVTLRDGDMVYPTNTTETNLTWQLWDDKTPTEEIEYRIRVDRGNGFSEWTDWQFAPSDGRVSPDIAYDAGITRVQLQVRDGVNRTAVRNADIVVSPGVPQTTLAAPDDPTSDAVYVRVLPERRIERLEFEYRRAGAETFQPWKNITDTRNLGRLSAPATGDLVIRARAVGLDGDVSAWATEQVTYEQRDTEPPETELVQAPAIRPTPTPGGIAERRVTNAAETTLAWSVEDDTTPTDDLEYRIRTTDGSWSAWQATDDGIIETTVDVQRSGTVTRLQVRDAAGNVASREVAVYRDTDEPSVSVTASDDVLGAVVDPNSDEPLRRLQIQVRGENQSTWETVESLPDADRGTISVDATGSYELRVRGVDSAGNVGPWSDPTQFDSLPAEYGEPIIENETAFSGGTVQEYNVSDAVVGATKGYLYYNTLVNEIDGELLLDLYMVSREGNRIPVSSIELTEERNQTIRADLPANLTSDAKLRVEVRGNGTVVLSSLRAIGAGPDVPPPTVSPDRPNVGEPVHLSVTEDWPGERYVSAFEWDIDGDGTFEAATETPSFNTTYQTGGTRTVTVAVTDIFGATRTANATVSVNAPPAASFPAPEPVKTGETVELNASGSRDPDGSITAYRWSIEGGDDRSGSVTTASFPDDGTYSVTLVVEDGNGATDRVSRNVTVENRPPQIAAAANDTDPLIGEPVRFSAAESVDVDGSITEFAWDFDGDGTYERSGTQVVDAFAQSGNRTISVRVTDDDGATNTTTVRVHVNAPPESRLNVSSPVLTNETVVVDATGSTDPDGTIVGSQWQVTGPAMIADGTLTDTVSYPDDGVYPVTVTVVDDDGAVDTTTRNITVENRPPNASGQVGTETPVVGQPVELTAVGSEDPDGTVQSTSWDTDGDGAVETNGTAATPVYDSFGVQTATVTVTDDDGATNDSTVTFYVNAPPRASIESTDPALTNESIRLRAVNDTDPDGRIVEYAWDTDGDGDAEANGTSTTVSFPDDGTYTVALTVTDNNGTATTVRRNVTVENRPPRADVARNVTVPLVDERVSFDAAASTDRDGSVTAYEWDVDGDGQFNRSGATITTAFAEPGNQTVTLRVTDDDGATNTTTVTVRVNEPPIANISGPQSARTGEEVKFTAVGSFDPDGQITQYVWGGPTERTTGRNVTAVFPDDGNYTVNLTVTDDDGATATATTVVEVTNQPPSATLSRVNRSETVTTGESVIWNTTVTDTDGTIENATLRLSPPGSNETTQLIPITGEETAFELNASGVWNVTLVAIDDDGARTVRRTTVDVNARPTAEIVVPEAPVAGEPVTLTAAASDRDGTVVSYEWVIGDRVLTGQEVTFTPETDGEQFVRLIVTDDDGAERLVSRPVDIGSGLDAEVRVERFFGGRILSAHADIEAEDPGPVRYRWDVDGDGVFESTGGERVISEPGTYEFTVRATLTETNRTVVANETVTVESLPEDIRVNWTSRSATGGEPAADHGQIYIPAGEQGFNEDPRDVSITALSQATGAQNWEVSLPFNPYRVRTTDDAVYAIGRGIARIDPKTGTVRWSVVPEGYPEITLTDERVFIGSDDSLRAINATTGDTVWNRSGMETDQQLVSDGRLIVSDQEFGFPGQSTLVAYDVETGDIVWNRTDNGTWSVLTTVDGRMIANDDGELRAYDAGTGTLDWATTPQPNGSTNLYIEQAVVRNGTIVVKAEDYPRGYVLGLTFDGSVEWSQNLSSDQRLAPGTGQVYAIGGGNATAFNPTTGEVQWDRQVPIDFPTTIGDSLRPIVVTDGGQAIVLDPETGETLWRGPTGNAIYRATYVDGTIYLVTDDGTYAVDLLSERLPSN